MVCVAFLQVGCWAKLGLHCFFLASEVLVSKAPTRASWQAAQSKSIAITRSKFVAILFVVSWLLYHFILHLSHQNPSSTMMFLIQTWRDGKALHSSMLPTLTESILWSGCRVRKLPITQVSFKIIHNGDSAHQKTIVVLVASDTFEFTWNISKRGRKDEKKSNQGRRFKMQLNN